LAECVICKRRLPQGDGSSICDICIDHLRRPFRERKVCPRCGRPLGPGSETVCFECATRPSSFGRVYPGAFYRDPVAALVKRMKYGGEAYLATPLAYLLADALLEALPQYDVLVPVPLTAKKLAERGYNQSELVARRLFQIGGPRVIRALIKTQDHPAQAGLSRAERLTNLSGTIALHPRHGRSIVGKSVLVIDDVFTTGATVHACADVLLAGDAGQVDVAVIATGYAIPTEFRDQITR
jgi:ComF family protein